MPKFELVGISGSTRRPSRSRALVETIAREVQAPHNIKVYDILDAGPGLGAAFTREELSAPAALVVEAIEKADGLIVSSPVYKGSYTGLFKHLFDFIPPQALSCKPVVLAAAGGGSRHALVVEHQLRPLFAFFTALTAPTAVYASEDDFRDCVLVNADVLRRAAAAAQEFSGLLEVSRRARDLEALALPAPNWP